jgi:hypothetical protein
MKNDSHILRRNFLKMLSLGGMMGVPFSINASGLANSDKKPNPDSREYWVSVMVRIARPVLKALSEGKLHASMPIEVFPGNTRDRSKVSHLEALGRLMAGIAPWLEIGPDETDEGKLRATYTDLARKGIAQAVDPASPDFMDFEKDAQALVDAAFLAHGLLRAPKQLWEPLGKEVKKNVVDAFKSTRAIKPGQNNWLLFMAMIEAFLLKTGNGGDVVRIDYAVRKHLDWYKGDGVYGDGDDFHWDYYNSFVIQPMLLDVVKIFVEAGKEKPELYEKILERARRYAVVQERLISPEGTFPPIGRSLAYRFGAFQTLAQIAWMKQLPEEINPAQVRSALSAVIHRSMSAAGTFDKNDWLQIGFCGHQTGIAENYISTGSLYLCTVGMLPLGLPATDIFWSAPSAEWTAKKIWSGKEVVIDRAF